MRAIPNELVTWSVVEGKYIAIDRSSGILPAALSTGDHEDALIRHGNLLKHMSGDKKDLKGREQHPDLGIVLIWKRTSV